MLQRLQDPQFRKIALLDHGFFTREGGVSDGCYASLNCAYSSDDHPDNVSENRRRIMTLLGYPVTALMTVNHVHGAEVVVIDETWPGSHVLCADALVTSLPQRVLGATSADCPIVLFVDESAGVIGIAHAGWKGAKQGVIEAAVKRMLMLGATPSGISAAISPCIGQDSYEVDEQFYQQFLSDNTTNHCFFKVAERPRHLLFDLVGFVKNRLLRLQLKNISSEAAIDTYRDERFFSCRRAAHHGEPDFGRQLSCIVMR